jgi:(1->4)-alpha-D-glucan 1-alpha-D-glucosylmutase
MRTFGEFDPNLTATYRLQFHKDFTFQDGAAIAGYLRDLGVSHVYASPILTARAGSMHGYDVVDFGHINPELGGEEGLAALVDALHGAGLGLIVDIVPNHMAVGGEDNPFWLDLLENGQDSRFADFFDVDFYAPATPGKVLVPFLGGPYGEVLRSGDLVLKPRPENDRYAIYYHEHCFPLREESQAEIRSQGADPFSKPEDLHALLEAQHYRLASWRAANDLINYRRFFDITSLAAIRIERAETFDIVHEVPLRLYEQGWIDGLRVDHVDGLTDPRGYCEKLSEALLKRRASRPENRRGAPYIIVENILASNERMPDWPVAGTTGYDFMNEVSAVQHDNAGAQKLGAFWREISGRSENFEDEESLARRELLARSFDGQFEAAIDALSRCGTELGADRDLTRNSVVRAVQSVISHMRVYRSYATGGAANPGIGPYLEAAFDTAAREAGADEDALLLVRSIMNSKSSHPDFAEAIRRFNQLTAPVAAKAVEDTAFYRYGRLLSRNDVGFNAAVFGMDLTEFHHRMADRAVHLPHSLLATATHDHKRGEDVRARLAVLSEIPDLWTDRCREWSALNVRFREGGFHSADEHMLYQMIVGAWPLELKLTDLPDLRAFADRLVQWQQKALREAKLRSSWLAPNEGYERVAEAFTRGVLDGDRSRTFVASVADFVEKIGSAGLANALTQTALRCLAPGVPDLYRGSELWDFTLVDPDNRRPVDFNLRVELSGEAKREGEPEYLRSGAVKQKLIQTLLQLRRREPDLFAFGDYQDIAVNKTPGGEVLAFRRRHEGRTLVAAMALRGGALLFGSKRLVPPPDVWGDARLNVEEAKYRCVWGEADLFPGQTLAGIFAQTPVAVWIGEG